MKSIALIIALCMCFVGCMQQERMGPHRIVTLYSSDGKVIQRWESAGYVAPGFKSDMFSFEDSKTGEMVFVTGTVTVTEKL